jgi:hypothetical protein
MKSLGFNFVRVPVSWTRYANGPSNFTSELDNIVVAADANGISVVIDFHQIQGWDAWPQDMLTYYNAVGGAEPGYDNMLTAWFKNNATYSWQDMVDQFWKPIIQAVDSHPSVIGYEIMNEPYFPDGITVAQMQAHNQFFANALRNLTSKAIVYMAAANSLEQQGSTIVSTAPTGISNLVLDVHRYGTSDPSSDFSTWKSEASSIGAAVFVGEWGPDCSGSVSQSVEQNTITLYYDAFSQYGLGNAYWSWSSGTGVCNLLDNNNNPSWVSVMLSNAIASSWKTSASTTSYTAPQSSSSMSTTAISTSVTITHNSSRFLSLELLAILGAAGIFVVLIFMRTVPRRGKSVTRVVNTKETYFGDECSKIQQER